MFLVRQARRKQHMYSQISLQNSNGIWHTAQTAQCQKQRSPDLRCPGKAQSHCTPTGWLATGATCAKWTKHYQTKHILRIESNRSVLDTNSPSFTSAIWLILPLHCLVYLISMQKKAIKLSPRQTKVFSRNGPVFPRSWHCCRWAWSLPCVTRSSFDPSYTI